jgi:hypothetical protein
MPEVCDEIPLNILGHVSPIYKALSLGVKRLDHDADHLPPSRTEVENAWWWWWWWWWK